ncbi:hypothetical protein ACXITP_00805 [Actinotignum sanguinis]|uniref:Uncharacterized protein n=3 Tax=Actinomycetaceae TaxID=2049 RepID=A0ABZ0RCB2_9ACTO|nr:MULTISPECIES: hypothetical protein [Actinotignum]WPJ88589.1 hypothetical protein R0V15_06895 [Schaalia turicensis]MDE1553029.1 hypothetical protein [Actinotignum sanguinis]MDE1565928.1 hypothetical protein [Actinotignum sanguinis]MDE1577516.1 hypothetical protein [Actinotignum sanguinis]MDE1641682.1 hypothetical protein [Actinotignum sanguinis]
MVRVSPDPDWTPVPFRQSWSGHLIAGTLTAIGIVITLALSRLFLPHQVNFFALLLIVVLSTVAVEFLSTHIDRWHQRRWHHPSPGGWIAPLSRIAFFAGVYFLVTLVLTLDSRQALICGGVATAVAIIEVIGIRQWKTGVTIAEEKEATLAAKKALEDIAIELRIERQEKARLRAAERRKQLGLPEDTSPIITVKPGGFEFRPHRVNFIPPRAEPDAAEQPDNHSAESPREGRD